MTMKPCSECRGKPEYIGQDDSGYHYYACKNRHPGDCPATSSWGPTKREAADKWNQDHQKARKP